MSITDDNIDPTIADVTDQEITHAIGGELRRARQSIGWSRPELISHMKTRMPVNTYACYEQGIRPCSIPRLVEICQALETDAADLLGRALQTLGLRPASPRCTVDEFDARLRALEDVLFPDRRKGEL